jgi:hypothetical protein
LINVPKSEMIAACDIVQLIPEVVVVSVKCDLKDELKKGKAGGYRGIGGEIGP